MKHSIKGMLKLFLLVAIVLISCNKTFNKNIYESIDIKNNDVINKFLSTPDNLSPDKIVIIGRKMDIIRSAKSLMFPNAEIFDGNAISNTAQEGWNNLKNIYNGQIPEAAIKNSLLFKENIEFIQKYKELGYTFIDIGDPLNIQVKSYFYDMEIENLFK